MVTRGQPTLVLHVLTTSSVTFVDQAAAGFGRPLTNAPGRTYMYEDRPLWYCASLYPFPRSYAHPWSVTADGATVAFSQISRMCPTSGFVEFKDSVPAGSLRFQSYWYHTDTGLEIQGCRGITRTHQSTHLDCTRYGDSHRRRRGGTRETRFVLELLLDDAQHARLHTYQTTGEVVALYAYTEGQNSVFGSNAWSDGNSYGGTYQAHGVFESIEVTGSIDGLLEAVITFAPRRTPDAVLGTAMFTEVELDNSWAAPFPDNAFIRY